MLKDPDQVQMIIALLIHYSIFMSSESSNHYWKFANSIRDVLEFVFSVYIRISIKGDVAEEGGSGAETDAAEGSGAAASEEGSGAEGSGDEECAEGSGDDIESLLAPSKCKNKGAEMSGADALAEALGGGSCDTSGMDESVRRLRYIEYFR